MPPPATRRRTFIAVVAAQFLSSLADNALLIVAIGHLAERNAAAWMVPALRLFFYFSYVLLAPLAGPLADSWPKGRIMFFTNLVKVGGGLLLAAHIHPLLAYALVGAGAAAYAPAKYGILPELFADSELVAANAWIEVSTVVSILLGVGLGSLLMAADSGVPQILSSQTGNASLLLTILYAAATCCTLAIAATGARQATRMRNPAVSLARFRRAFVTLWRDPQGQISLAVTSLFWAVSATLQFLILQWAADALHMTLSQAALLQGSVALGMVAGAIVAARWVPTSSALAVLPVGVAIGAVVLLMPVVHDTVTATALLVLTGVLSGIFLVPMNALLQQRGSVLMRTGESIAVQNFNENLASLILLAVYGVLLYAEVALVPTIVCFGVFVSLAMALIMARHHANTRRPAER